MGNVEYPFIAITSRFSLTRVLVPVSVLSIGQIDLFKNYSKSIGPCAKNLYEAITQKNVNMNIQ